MVISIQPFATGAIHTGPPMAETCAHFTGGTGVTTVNGEIAIDADVVTIVTQHLLVQHHR